MSKKITLIIPVVSSSDNLAADSKRLMGSIAKLIKFDELVGEVLVTGPKSALSGFDKDEFGKLVLKENETDNYARLVNDAVMDVTSEYFSVLEPNDEISPAWLLNFERFEQSNMRGDIYLYLSIARNQDGEFISFVNEIAWSSGFVDKHGFVTEQCLKAFFLFKVTGGILNTEDFISLGKLKTKLGVATWYEYLYRASMANKQIVVIPKTAIVHHVNTEVENTYCGGVSLDNVTDTNAWMFEASQAVAASNDDAEIVKPEETKE